MADLDRLERASPLGPNDDAWLVLALAMARFAELSSEELRLTVPQSADAIVVSAIATGLAPTSNVMRAAIALRTLFDPASAGQAPTDVISELVVATQNVAEEQELAGAFGLAYATLHGLLDAFGNRIPLRMRGNIRAQQARAVRQCGRMDTAEELYDDAMVIGYECDALDVVARALLGMGVLATTKGNHPLARQQFERALVNADLACDPELIRAAHHGLLNASVAAGDLDAALIHGWNVLRLSIAPELRAEALLNMAEICRMAGEHEAAIRTYAVATEWTTQSHVRLHALSGSLRSAIAMGRHDEARTLRDQVEACLPTITDAYTRAVIGVELAESLDLLGDRSAAVSHLNAAMAVSAEHQYHKVIHQAERVAKGWHIAPPVQETRRSTTRARPHRSAHFRMVLRSLHGLAASSR